MRTDVRMGCVKESLPELYHADTLICKNKNSEDRCTPLTHLQHYMGCYECSHKLCEDVLINYGYRAKTICPMGTKACYTAKRSDGVIFRGCYVGHGEGVRVCNDSRGSCVICRGRYCNHVQLVHGASGQCYKSNWRRLDRHETTLRFGDCTGSVFYGTPNHCYIATSSRLFMRMGCVSELVSGVDDTFNVIYGDASMTWLFPNSCFKCESKDASYCFRVDASYLHSCVGLNHYPVRGCYTIKDSRTRRVERGCVTEMSEYMMRICDMPVFHKWCEICQGDSCNDKPYNPF